MKLTLGDLCEMNEKGLKSEPLKPGEANRVIDCRRGLSRSSRFTYDTYETADGELKEHLFGWPLIESDQIQPGSIAVVKVPDGIEFWVGKIEISPLTPAIT